MLWRTHIRIADEILHKLGISKSCPEAESLRKGVITPDKWKDFPHHHSEEREIEKHIMKARGLFLEYDLNMAYYHLGVALHYVQDSYVSLSTHSEHHHRWEVQMDEAYFADNLQQLVERAFHNRPDRRTEYLERLRMLSDKIDGKKTTIRLATLPAMGLRAWGKKIWGKPYVDVNFALKASYLITKSVLTPKNSPELQEELKHIHQKYEGKLVETEQAFASSIVESIKKRNELENRKRKDGFLQTIKNGFLTISSKRHGFEAKRKLGRYKQKKHLTGVLKRYEKTIEKIVAPHHGWYDYEIPKLDLDVIENELLTVSEASKHAGVEEYQIQALISKGVISSYQTDNEELVRREELSNRVR